MKAGWKVRKLGELGAAIREQAKIAADQEYELWSVPSFELGTPETSLGNMIGSAKLRVRPNDVLICKINPRINRVWLVSQPTDGLEQIGSTEWLVYRANPDAGLLPRWLIHFVSAPKFREWITSEVSGATGSHTRAKADGILQQEIPVPPLAQQHRIIAILDEAFDSIATAKTNAERNLQNASALFESYLQAILIDRGQKWELKRLQEITSVLGDGLHGTPEYTEDGDYYFINGNNLEEGAIVFKAGTKKVSVDEYKKHKKNLTDRTILVSINGTLGKVAFFNNEKIILGKSACYFNLLDTVDKHFVKYLLSSSYFFKYAHKEATGATIKNVSLKSMRDFRLPLPSLIEQRSIVAVLDGLMKETRRLEVIYRQKLAAFDDLKKAVLNQAFMGAL